MKQTATKIFNTVFSRFNITILLVLLQAGYIALLVFRLSSYADWIRVSMAVLAIATCLFIMWRDYNPAYKISWMFFIGLLPSLGVLCYIIFGDKRPSRRMRKKLAPQEKAHESDLRQQDSLEGLEGKRVLGTSRYLRDVSKFPAWKNDGAKYYPLGDDMFLDMLEDLKAAKHFIFLEYFIISEGYMWRSIEEILKEKAAEGLDVRVVYDDIGSMKTLPKNFNKNLEEAGIKVITFNAVLPLISFAYNNRDHRKILVIDGNVGYTGGANLADEYINKLERFGHWKDAAVRIEGNAVWNFTVMFLNIWNAFRKTDSDYNRYRPAAADQAADDNASAGGFVQPYCDSPLDEEHVGEFVYLDIISQAKKYVYIFTPYLLIDSELQTAIELAAKRGVEITIVTPHIPDKPLVFAITRSYYSSLMKMGVRIMEYAPGFVHSKVFIADDKVATVGTVNVDFRSFFFHFEDGVLLIDTPCIKDIKADFIKTFDKCTLVTPNFMSERFIGRVIGMFLRVLSPLM